MTAAAGTDGLPSALERLPELLGQLTGKRPAVFLDYDGTLTPIVDRPDLAVLSADMRAIVRRLAQACTVAVVSGRDRRDVEQLVQLPDIFYAGSHGFDIRGPNGETHENEAVAAIPQLIPRVAAELHERIDGIEGAIIEPKRYAVAVHYRLVAPARVAEVERHVDEVVARYPQLKKTGGKKVHELRPAIDWDKGKALLWLLRALDLNGSDVVPFYLGDDVTDEDAFTVLAGWGIGILVADAPQRTRARYGLRDPGEVREFLTKIEEYLDGVHR